MTTSTHIYRTYLQVLLNVEGTSPRLTIIFDLCVKLGRGEPIHHPDADCAHYIYGRRPAYFKGQPAYDRDYLRHLLSREYDSAVERVNRLDALIQD